MIPELGLPGETHSHDWFVRFQLPDGQTARIYEQISNEGCYLVGICDDLWETTKENREAEGLLHALALAHHLIQTHSHPKELTTHATEVRALRTHAAAREAVE
jgi:hypothetical protein